MDLPRAVRSDKTIRTVGFDDAPFSDREGGRTGLAGVVCEGTRFDGMVWGDVAIDGWDGTERVCELLEGGKFLPQLHLVLLDGIAFGGFNVVDLQGLARRLDRPCAAVMRERPDRGSIRRALQHVPDPERRWDRIERAGEVHRDGEVYYQVAGAEPEVVGRALDRLLRAGHVPEPLRIAHQVATAVAAGESGRRA